SGVEETKTNGASIPAPTFFRASPADQTLVAEIAAFSRARRSICFTSSIRTSPSKPRQTLGGRSSTFSRSQPTGVGPATAIVRSPQCDADTDRPAYGSGLPPGLLVIATDIPNATWPNAAWIALSLRN